MKALLSLFTLLAIGLAVGAGVYAMQQSDLADQRLAKVADLKKQISDLNGENGALQGEVDRLTGALGDNSLPARPTSAAEIAEIEFLKDQLAKAKADLAAAKAEGPPKEAAEGGQLAVNPPEGGRQQRGGRGDDRDWEAERRERMERMKTEDPEAYKEFTERRTSIRSEIRQGLDDRLAFFQGMDLEGLPPELQASHNEMLVKMASLRETMAKLEADPDSTAGGFSEIRETMVEIDGMLKKEREVLMTDLAVDLGYEGEDAQKFIDTVDYIRDMTSAPRPSFGGRGGRGGGPDGGGGGGRRGGGGGGGPR